MIGGSSMYIYLERGSVGFIDSSDCWQSINKYVVLRNCFSQDPSDNLLTKFKYGIVGVDSPTSPPLSGIF